MWKKAFAGAGWIESTLIESHTTSANRRRVSSHFNLYPDILEYRATSPTTGTGEGGYQFVYFGNLVNEGRQADIVDFCTGWKTYPKVIPHIVGCIMDRYRAGCRDTREYPAAGQENLLFLLFKSQQYLPA